MCWTPCDAGRRCGVAETAIPLYRTGKVWRDPDLDGLLVRWNLEGDRLTVWLLKEEVIAQRRDQSIAMKSQWRCRDEVYETRTCETLPAGGLMRVVAVRQA